MGKRIKLFSEIPTLESDRLVIRPLTQADAEGLRELVSSESAYRYLPTFLFERKYDDVHEVIDRLYTECLQESMILGVFMDGQFCGLTELYGHREPIHKISIGARFLERFWGRGIAGESLARMIDYLYNETDTEIITASSMPANRGSAHVLEKNGFTLVSSGYGEDWGFPELTPADKWIR